MDKNVERIFQVISERTQVVEDLICCTSMLLKENESALQTIQLGDSWYL